MKVKESEKADLKLSIQKTKIMATGPITSWQIDRKTMKTVTDFISLGSKITADGDCLGEIKRCLLLGKKAIDKPRQCIKKQRHYFVDKGPSSQKYDFFSSCVWMWELDNTKSWVTKNWCFWTVVLEKTLESSLGCKEIKPVNTKGSHPWIFIGRIDAEAEAPILWIPDIKSWLLGKDPDAGKDWRQEEKGMTEDYMVGWHHWLNGYGFEQAPKVGDGQASLVCFSPWGCKESDMTEQLNNKNMIIENNFLYTLFPSPLIFTGCQYRRLKRYESDPWVGKIPWSRKWQTTPVFLPGESLGWRSLTGCCPWGRKVR